MFAVFIRVGNTFGVPCIDLQRDDDERLIRQLPVPAGCAETAGICTYIIKKEDVSLFSAVAAAALWCY